MIISCNDPNYRQCSISVMDNIADPDIFFDEKGICNYYYEYKSAEKSLVKKGADAERELQSIIERIKQDGKGNKYDCVLGVSGGVDSTYLAYYASKVGLRVLCVHFDNGWNSELAVKNIENIVNKFGFDLYTYVINWEEFRDIQLSYFKANVVDIEAVSDIAILAALDKICVEQRIKHILIGLNVATEITLPKSWICKNSSNLRDIHKTWGTKPIRSFPLMSPIRRRIVARTKPFQNWLILNYLPYIKKDIKEIIKNELGWRDYGGKHYESIFTRFYQGYILPNKFHIDKRKAHLSNLIFSGQMTKEEALKELERPIYPPEIFKSDYEFVLKKLGFTKEEFEHYIKSPSVPHSEYDLSLSIFDELEYLKPLRWLFGREKVPA